LTCLPGGHRELTDNQTFRAVGSKAIFVIQIPVLAESATRVISAQARKKYRRMGRDAHQHAGQQLAQGGPLLANIETDGSCCLMMPKKTWSLPLLALKGLDEVTTIRRTTTLIIHALPFAGLGKSAVPQRPRN
jgi:hypothetical protein